SDASVRDRNRAVERQHVEAHPESPGARLGWAEGFAEDRRTHTGCHWVVSAQTGGQDIGGITQPIIGQRKIEHEIRLKDGEVNVLGGIMEDQQTKALSGIPGLASIPILKYLFSQSKTERQETEIVFVLVPHIIRGPEQSRSAELLDVGTANAIELRLLNTKPVPPPAAAPAVPQGTPPSQGGQNLGARNAPAAGGASFMFDPPTLTQAKGSTFTVNVMVAGGQNVYSVPVQL